LHEAPLIEKVQRQTRADQILALQKIMKQHNNEPFARQTNQDIHYSKRSITLECISS